MCGPRRKTARQAKRRELSAAHAKGRRFVRREQPGPCERGSPLPQPANPQKVLSTHARRAMAKWMAWSKQAATCATPKTNIKFYFPSPILRQPQFFYVHYYYITIMPVSPRTRMSSMAPRVIAIEGNIGAGKSTLLEALRGQGYTSPGGFNLGSI